MSSIQILTAEGQSLGDQYIASRLVRLWRQAGHQVMVSDRLHQEVDLVLMHHNSTWPNLPNLPNLSGLSGIQPSHRPILLNDRVRDISKRRFSQQLLTPSSDWPGPVIIKTNANFFGLPELQKLPIYKMRLILRRLVTLNNWRILRQLPWKQYPVLDSLAAVPDWIWQRPELVVEKFIPERDGELYVMRTWLFFGDRSYGVKIWGRYPVVKHRGIVRYEYRYEVPPELEQQRQALAFDFGKFDYVMHQGQAKLLDINTTPTTAAPVNQHSDNLVNLAAGIAHYLSPDANTHVAD